MHCFYSSCNRSLFFFFAHFFPQGCPAGGWQPQALQHHQIRCRGVHLYSHKSVWSCQEFREPGCERYSRISFGALGILESLCFSSPGWPSLCQSVLVLTGLYLQLQAETEPCAACSKENLMTARLWSSICLSGRSPKVTTGQAVALIAVLAWRCHWDTGTVRGYRLRCCRQRGGSAYPGQCAGSELVQLIYNLYHTSDCWTDFKAGEPKRNVK